jgi:hypothetical protein
MNLSPRRGLIDSESTPRRCVQRRRRPSKVRSSIEGLENRTLLSTITWDSADYPKGGSWDTPGNWIGDAVLTSTDTAVINLSSGGTYNADGGSITGPGYLIGSKLVETASPANHPDRRHRRHADDNQTAQHDFVGAGQRQVHLRQRHAGGGRRPEQLRHHPAGVLQPDRHRRRQQQPRQRRQPLVRCGHEQRAAGAKVRCLARPRLFPRQTCVHRST